MDHAVYQPASTPWRVRDMPERLRPREEAARIGVQNVSDDVLLAIVLRSGTPGRNVADLSRQLLRDHGSLTAVSRLPSEALASTRGIGPVKAQVLVAAFELARRLAEETEPDRTQIRTPDDVARLLRPRARALEAEAFWVVTLDTKNRVQGTPREITRGLLDASLIHPREVFRQAIHAGSAAIVLAHNHPSGDPSPSAEDLRVTRQLVAAGQVVDIRVMDHVVLGRPRAGRPADFVSMRESGLLDFGR